MTPVLSVIVCTLNQADFLRKALESLGRQTLPKTEYEVIVVDNGSKDSTKQMVESFRDAGNLNYLYDPVQGLSHARNTGWQNAGGEYIAYLDDDATASPDWLEKIRNRYETLLPSPASVGGRILPIWETEKPSWLTEELERHLSITDWHCPPMFLDKGRFYLAGSNVSYRRSALKESGGFPISLGRKGRRLLSNEELWMQLYLFNRGYAVWYDPDIVVHHHIKAQRLTPSWFYERFFWQGISDVLLDIEISGWKEQQKPRLPRIGEDLYGIAANFVGHIKSRLSGTRDVVYPCRIHQRLGRMMTEILPGFAREAFSGSGSREGMKTDEHPVCKKSL